MKRKRGNPNWGKESCVNMGVVPTRWDVLRESLKIAEDDRERMLRSMKLRQFAISNCNGRYIPPWYLDAMGLTVNDDDVYITAPRDFERMRLQ